MTRKRKWILRIALALAALFLALAAAAFWLPQKLLCVDSGPVKADVIVVLGGGSGERPARAAELFKELDAPRIIVSGFGDCENNRRILLKAGVPAGAIQLEDKSRTTRENAGFTLKLLRAENARRVILVTTWYHSRRALACFEHYAPEIQFYSRPSYFAFARADWPHKKIEHRVY
ncbi:MAG: YdcF family protein, partial [Verrucomicrobiota bacterium]